MNESTLQPVMMPRAPRFREAAYSAIKEAILSGAFSPQQPLIEEHIAARLAISRTPVREALSILEHERLLAPRSGRGLYVALLDRAAFAALFIANETVEPYLVRQAALSATPEQLAALHKSLERAARAAQDLDTTAFLRASRDFHRLVGQAAGNEPLTSFVVHNEERTDMYLVSTGTRIDGDNMRISIDEHAAILNAIARRDPESGARLAVYHAQSLRHRFADLFVDGASPL